MNKLSLFAVIASLSLAAPAFAQTPSDIRNGRATVPAATSSEVHLDRHNSSAMHNGEMDSNKEPMEHHGKKHHGHKHAMKKHHHGKKHHHKKNADAATDNGSK